MCKRARTTVPSEELQPAKTKLKMTAPTDYHMEEDEFHLDNISDGEEVHQRCVLLSGQCPSSEKQDGYSETDYIMVNIKDLFGCVSFPPQSWPVARGCFKALVLLTNGVNKITMTCHRDSKVIGQLELQLQYMPLTQLPPLHLAIMVGNDSPLVIDCPHSKQRGISSTHADLDAAIAKFRMTAYMWQAMTAEDFRQKGLGRRSFRLEEEWALDTVSRKLINQPHNGGSLYNESGLSPMRSTAKVHVTRSDKTVAELRDTEVAQQNECGSQREGLHQFFSDALREYGMPFQSSCRPVVAGLILDSTYSTENDLILGHAALGSHDPNGLSLGIFGSHLSFSWPRFLEEVPACLLDTTPRDDSIGNDNGECETAWEACAVSQGAFLHEVGHAFGADHTTGIMARGYSPDWTKNFLPLTAHCAHRKSPGVFVEDVENKARWDTGDALLFRSQPHFRQPQDKPLSAEARRPLPSVQIQENDDGTTAKVVIGHAAGIARVAFNGVEETQPTMKEPIEHIEYSMSDLKTRFGKDSDLSLHILAMNGKERNIRNLWKRSNGLMRLRIPGSSIVLEKRSAAVEDIGDSENKHWEWAVLLNRRKKDGSFSRAVAIDIRVGMLLDGAVVHFDDDKSANCGPRWRLNGEPHRFGGGASEEIHIPPDIEIRKVDICRTDNRIWGMRIYLSDGSDGGELNEQAGEIVTLQPPSGHKIIGFYGRNKWPYSFSEVDEFGIVTAPRDVEIPVAVYEMAELKNGDGGVGRGTAPPGWEDEC
ncbi:hypothetical protein AJ80_00132 [Polytolypa hystricis UAMH7299]|uniref:Jacalin-type lectin domain-containing protein n=1 Tax=Polytolypa hystricis (strain UAMH7299) TaxID=1447883 RepID=A0A2B7Z4F5_POLH7|nr:hypothetical protein AJ80_00132 [Polytolypa hystricis UAMH7299]